VNVLALFFVWRPFYVRVIAHLSIVLVFVQIGLAQPNRVPGVAKSQGASTEPQIIVVGFVGGFIRHNNMIHSEVQLAARLRKDYPMGVYVETFESYHEKRALKRILKLLDTNRDVALTSDEKQNARIIIYGHSWGGSDTIALARDLDGNGVPVLLTIQIDSVTQVHRNDSIIPANVSQAVNFYQADGRMHGQSKIVAADSTRTKIIGNFKFDYAGKPYNCHGYPWYDRVFGKAHTQIECDSTVWAQAEALIRMELPAPTTAAVNHAAQP
jgi:hypothetical protein